MDVGLMSIEDVIIRDLRRTSGKRFGRIENRIDRQGDSITDLKIRIVELEKWVRVLAADRGLGWPTNRPRHDSD